MLRAEADATGLWSRSGEVMCPDMLPIPSALSARITAWQESYDFEEERHPGAPPWEVYGGPIKAINAEGRVIARILKTALPPGWAVFVEDCDGWLRKRAGEPRDRWLLETTSLHIHRAAPPDWRRVRATRLAALADAPDAFGTTLAEDEARPAEDWQRRLARTDTATFLALDPSDTPVGLAVGAPWEDRAATAGLFGMWVAPEARGTGAGDALVRAVIAWARASSHTRLLLEVGDHNAPAEALYRRHGFVPTGETTTLPPPRDHVPEHRMALGLKRRG